MHKKNTHCRICLSETLVKVISLGTQALANSFLKKEDLDSEEHAFPLDVYWCETCHLAQLLDVVSKELMFSNYIYFSSGMPKLSDHFSNYAMDVMERFLEPNDFVVEIASNDGILLKFFKERGYRVLGIDPATNVVKIAEERGVPTMNDFFSEVLAKEIVKTHGKAKTIMANNVVAHIDDHHDLAKGIAALLSDDGVFVFEAPYLIDMFLELAYDTVYHEHLSFLAIRPLQVLFKKYGLEIFDVKLYPVQGSSIRVFVGKQGAHNVLPSVATFVQKEVSLGLDTREAYEILATRVAASKDQLVTLLQKLKQEGKTLAGYGAPAKGN
ncbi:MAG: SAM-dependent methyltransferase, partial [Candidatus Magasanikbacteria bacterium CG10_big_fil_rev_8_21_14_0_10_43_6]